MVPFAVRDVEDDLTVTRRFTWTGAVVLLLSRLPSYDVHVFFFIYAAKAILQRPRKWG